METKIARKIKFYINRLNKNKAKGIIYENMGYEWFNEFKDWLGSLNLHYSEQCEAERAFNQAVDNWYNINY